MLLLYSHPDNGYYIYVQTSCTPSTMMPKYMLPQHLTSHANRTHFHNKSGAHIRPVTRILCGGVANEAKVDQTTEMYFLMSDPFI